MAQLFCVFLNEMFAKLRGREAGNASIYQLLFSVCCMLWDFSATLFQKKKKKEELSLLNQGLYWDRRTHRWRSTDKHSHSTDSSCSFCSSPLGPFYFLVSFASTTTSKAIICSHFHENSFLSREKLRPFQKELSRCIVVHLCIQPNPFYRVTYNRGCMQRVIC